MNNNTLQQIEALVYLRDISNLKDIPKTFHTILLKEDFLQYMRNITYTASYNTLVYLRFVNVDYEITALDISRPILSTYVIERNKMSKKARDKINAFENWVATQ